MVDFSDHDDVKTALETIQEDEFDMREIARENDHMLNKRDGQWEPSVINNMTGRPRYTFDKLNPIIDQIAGEIEQSEFSINVIPSSGDSSSKTAQTYEGMIRNIENISNADEIYNAAGRRMLEVGIAGWRVTHRWPKANTFHQDLMVKPIHNFLDRVWFDPDAENQDKSDAKFAYVLHVLSKESYDEKWNGRGGLGLSTKRMGESYFFKKESIIIGEVLYLKPRKVQLVLMSNGDTYVVDEKFNMVKDELANSGIIIIREREREVNEAFRRYFDGEGWLNQAKKLVFDTIPIVPLFANYKISEDKPIWRSATEKLLDQQRVYNYIRSRQVEEGALAPREKTWMTEDQAEGHTAELASMNISADPVQYYNHVEGVPPPYKTDGYKINMGLQQLAIDISGDINAGIGLFGANQGDNPNLQSGIAIERIQNKGDNTTFKYFNSLVIGRRRTAEILINAIPKVYDNKRQQRLLNKDGTFNVVYINDSIFDQQTNKLIEINNLSKGVYDIECTVGPAFKNRQQQTVNVLTEMARTDPTVLEVSADIVFGNMDTPGMDKVAERKRHQLLKSGIIPDSQMTEEEKQLVAKWAAMAKPTPTEQALINQANAEADKAKAAAQEILSKIEERSMKIALAAEKQEQAYEVAMQNMVLKFEQLYSKNLNQQADTLKKLAEAIGSQSIVSPEASKIIMDQLGEIKQAQLEN